jgi:hypothetical protein
MVATPSVQDAARQAVAEPGKAQASRVAPSQAPAQEEPSVAQAVRAPWGAPVTAAQLPTLPATSHASHWPVHAVSQQTPSTQEPLAHWPGPPQVSPGPFRGVHTPAAQ